MAFGDLARLDDWMLPPQEPVAPGPSVRDAYRMGGLAAMDQYREGNPEQVFGAHDKVVAKQRAFDALPQIANAPEPLYVPSDGASLDQQIEQDKELAKFFVPTSPLDVGLMVAGGPVGGKLAKGAAVGLGALLGADEAEAGPIGKAIKRIGWSGPVGNLAEAGAIPRGTHANWFMRHDPQGNVTLSNESGPTGNTYAIKMKRGMTPEEMAAHPAGDPAIIPKGREFDLDELRRQNAHFVFGPTDKMASGGWLDLPGGAVKQEGGIGFMQAHKDVPIRGMPEDVQPLYASVSRAAASKANKIAQGVIDRGGVPYYVPTIMGPGAGDSTKQMAFSVLSELRNADPTPKAIEALDAAVRAKGKGAKGYPGYASPELSDWLTSSGLKGRRAFTEGASARSAADETGVDVSLLRYLNTDPRLRHTPSGSAGVVMGRMRPDVGVTEQPLHSNYPATFMGQKGEIGGLPGNMPFSHIAPDMFRGLLNYRSPGGGLFADTPAIQVMRGLAKDVPQTQPVTKEVVDNWRRWFDRNPQGWATIGGAPVLGGLAAQSEYQP